MKKTKTMKWVNDSPWVYHNERPEVKNAGERIPVTRPKVAKGTRVSQKDAQHRTKPAKNGTKIHISDGNFFPRPDTISTPKKRKPSAERARMRRRMRRQAARNGL